jgi:hypothetical protein
MDRERKPGERLVVRDAATMRANDDPKPFVWKNADEILDSLARYLQRVSGNNHQTHY